MQLTMPEEDQLLSYLSRALAYVSGPFERLVFLTSLRDHYTGRYIHEGWATCCSTELVHVTVRDAHRAAFDAVLQLPLVAVARDLREHFRSLGEVEELRVACLWLELEPYREMIPEGCPEISRRFFISQLHFALELLTRLPHWPHLEEPNAWPHQPPALRSRPQSVN